MYQKLKNSSFLLKPIDTKKVELLIHFSAKKQTTIIYKDSSYNTFFHLHLHQG